MLKWVMGEEHPDTLTKASNLAASLSGQGKHDDAEAMEREVLADFYSALLPRSSTGSRFGIASRGSTARLRRARRLSRGWG